MFTVIGTAIPIQLYSTTYICQLLLTFWPVFLFTYIYCLYRKFHQKGLFYIVDSEIGIC